MVSLLNKLCLLELCILWAIYLNKVSNKAYYLIERLRLLWNRIFGLKNSKKSNQQELKYKYSCRANWALSKNIYFWFLQQKYS